MISYLIIKNECITSKFQSDDFLFSHLFFLASSCRLVCSSTSALSLHRVSPCRVIALSRCHVISLSRLAASVFVLVFSCYLLSLARAFAISSFRLFAAPLRV